MADLPKPSRESVTHRVIPERPLTDVLKEAGSDLRKSIGILETGRVRIEAGSRLHQALEIIEYGLATGKFVPSQRGDDLGLRSLELSFDYSAIAATYPTDAGATFRRELRDSTVGPLVPPETARGPLQLQSQHVIRAALVRAGIIPTVPKTSSKIGKAPDLILTRDGEDFGLEVKRPQVMKNVLPRLADARDQLKEFGLRGGVLIDVTDCIRTVPKDQLDQEVRIVALSIYDAVFENGKGHRQGFEGIMMGGVFARLAWTTESTTTGAMINVHNVSTIGIFADSRDSPDDLRARWLRSQIERGLGRLEQSLDEVGGTTT